MTKYFSSSLFLSFPFLHLQLTSEFEGQVWERLGEKWGLRVGGRWQWQLAMVRAVASGGAIGGASGDWWLGWWWSLKGKNKRRQPWKKSLQKELVTNMFLCWQLKMITLTIILFHWQNPFICAMLIIFDYILYKNKLQGPSSPKFHILFFDGSMQFTTFENAIQF